MKKTLLVVLVIALMCSIYGFATTSPTLKDMIVTNPVIPFELAADIENGVALSPIYELFGKRIAAKFSIFEALDLEVQEDWELVEFKFIEEFTAEDTVIAIFDNDEEVTVLFLEYEDGVFPIDFTLVPNGYNRMYIVSDYEG